jgi:microcystin-dependent protein
MDEPLLGQLALVPYGFAPDGWATCKGQFIPIQQNTALFSLLGTKFGGDGKTTFALPTLEDPAENLHWIIALRGMYPTRP